MRPRKKKNLPARMDACENIWIKNPEAYQGKWNTLFEHKEAPLSVELGCGKGGFICALAEREPERNFVAIEKVGDVLVMAMEKAEKLNLPNLRFVEGDAKDVERFFAAGEIERLYINFCDPWHKKRHYKRRLTYRGFLRSFSRVLREDGILTFKTDNAPLFEFSLPEFEAAGYETLALTRDLHAENDPQNIVTEYEANFSAKGFKINRLIAKNVQPSLKGGKKMNVSFSTLGCPEWTFSEILSVASDIHYDGVEIRGIGSELYAPHIKQFLPDHIEQTKKALADRRISIPVLTSACLLSEDTEEMRQEGRDYIDLASKLGTPYVRVLGDRNPEADETVLDEIVAKNLSELAKYAEEKNVILLLETNGVYAQSKRAKKLMEMVDSDFVGILWDIHHPYRFFDESPEKTVEVLGDYIHHVHYKDSAKVDGKIVYRVPGKGDMPIEKILHALSEIDYDGFISIEWVRRWNPELEEAGIVFAVYADYIRREWEKAVK